MSAELTIFEAQLQPLAPRFGQALAGFMPADRLIRTLVISCERNPALLNCNRQSLINAAWSAAVLGLEVDGTTGQAFMIPFKNRAQLVIGYKGYTTIGARAGLTITGDVVREGDLFEYELGSRAFVHHRPQLGNRGRIIAAWASAVHKVRPPVVTVLSIDEILAVKQRSPAANKQDSPWNDPAIGFPAMAAKTAKRRLARSLPLTTLTLAAQLDEAVEERDKHAFIDQHRMLQIEQEAEPLPSEPSPTPTVETLIGDAASQGGAVVTPSDGASLQDSALAAARGGSRSFQAFWRTLDKSQQSALRSIGEQLRLEIDDADAIAADAKRAK